MESELPNCTPENWQAVVQTQLNRMERKIDTQGAQVKELEGRMDIADRDRATLTTQVEHLRTDAIGAIRQVVKDVLTEEKIAAKAATLDELEKRFGNNLESDLGQWSAFKRLFQTTASKAWLAVVSLAAGAGAVAMLERLF